MGKTNGPNIIFILIDDMGWKDLKCYGSEFYETPNIDSLASEGMRFTDAYAACPVCSPTRASILTGKYPAAIGLTDWIDHSKKVHPRRGRLIDAPYIDHLPLEEISLAKALKLGGYSTWHVGKWHLGKSPYFPENHGFDVNIAGCQYGHPPNGYFSPYTIENLEDGPEGEYLTDRLTNEAISLIEQKGEEPFFLNLWYYSVHTPIQAKKEDILKFEKKAQKMGLDDVSPFEEGELFPFENEANGRVVRRKLQSDPVYAAMVYNLDHNIGRLIESLEKNGMSDNTIIIFTSDNGGLATAEGSPTCNYPLNEGKGWMYEGGVREPLIIKWPNVVHAKSVCKTPVSSPDFYPTILQMAGLPLMPNQHKDGESLLPVIKGQGELEREALFWHYPHYGNQGGTPGSSIRMGDYKLIEFFEDGKTELYNLKEDIKEENDISGLYPETASKMKAMLREWREENEAKIPKPNLDHKD